MGLDVFLVAYYEYEKYLLNPSLLNTVFKSLINNKTLKFSFSGDFIIFKNWYESLTIRNKNKVKDMIKFGRLEILANQRNLEEESYNFFAKLYYLKEFNFLLKGMIYSKDACLKNVRLKNDYYFINKEEHFSLSNKDWSDGKLDLKSFFSDRILPRIMKSSNKNLLVLVESQELLNSFIQELYRVDQKKLNIIVSNTLEYHKSRSSNQNIFSSQCEKRFFNLNYPNISSLIAELRMYLNLYSKLIIENPIFSSSKNQISDSLYSLLIIECTNYQFIHLNSKNEKCESDIILAIQELKKYTFNLINDTLASNSVLKFHQQNVALCLNSNYLNYGCPDNFNDKVILLIINPNKHEYRYKIEIKINEYKRLRILDKNLIEIPSDVICRELNCKIHFQITFQDNEFIIPVILYYINDSEENKDKFIFNSEKKFNFTTTNNTLMSFNESGHFSLKKIETNFNLDFKFHNVEFKSLYEGTQMTQLYFKENNNTDVLLNFYKNVSTYENIYNPSIEIYKEVNFKENSANISETLITFFGDNIKLYNSQNNYICLLSNSSCKSFRILNELQKPINFRSYTTNKTQPNEVSIAHYKKNKMLNYTENSLSYQTFKFKFYLFFDLQNSYLENFYYNSALLMFINLDSININNEEFLNNSFEFSLFLNNLNNHIEKNRSPLILYDNKCLLINYYNMNESSQSDTTRQFILEVKNVKDEACSFRFIKCLHTNYKYKKLSFSAFESEMNFEILNLIKEYRTKSYHLKNSNDFIINPYEIEYFQIEISQA
jgi:hypothetical protein